MPLMPPTLAQKRAERPHTYLQEIKRLRQSIIRAIVDGSSSSLKFERRVYSATASSTELFVKADVSSVGVNTMVRLTASHDSDHEALALTREKAEREITSRFHDAWIPVERLGSSWNSPSKLVVVVGFGITNSGIGGLRRPNMHWPVIER